MNTVRDFLFRTIRSPMSVALMAACSTVAAAGAPAERRVSVGTSFDIALAGNPSTGYRWVLNEQESTGLDVVNISSLGYGEPTTGKPGMVGRPAEFGFRIGCITAGVATLKFNYVGPTGKFSGKTDVVSLECH